MIVTTRGGKHVEHRVTDFGNSNPPSRAGYGAAGVSVTPSTVAGIPAFNRAVRIAAEAVASLRMRVWRGEGVDRKRVDSVWQSRLLVGALNSVQSRFAFWETVEESLSKRGNAYCWMNSDAGRVLEVYALHPDQVLPILNASGSGIDYKVVVAPGFVDPTGKGSGFYSVGAGTILHIRGSGGSGALVSPSPIEVFRQSLGVGVARLQHEANSYEKGMALRGVVQIPAGIGRDAAEQWREFWKSEMEGANGQATAILGGGAEFKPISMTMADSQFIESQQFGVAECARIVGVPASLLDEGGVKGPSTPLSPEHEQARWLRYGLGPRLERIESALLREELLFPTGASVYPAFDTERFIRGDLLTEDAIAHARVQDGRLLVDEWRAEQGLPPLPDGAGSVPQIVPVGGAPNPSSSPAPPAGTPEPSPPAEAA